MTKRGNRRKGLLVRALALCTMLIMLCSMTMVVSATSANEAVTQAKKGVVQIQVWFCDPEETHTEYLWSGTGFLINENTVVTCNHVVDVGDEEFKDYVERTNERTSVKRTVEQVKQLLEIRISILRDVYVKATVKKTSAEMDYAILTLNETIENYTPLKLRESKELVQTEEVFALGFPGEIANIQETSYFNTEDVTVTSGRVNKVDNMDFYTTDGMGNITERYKNVNCVESSALITGGNSGGPLIDTNGNVVGINAAGSDTRNIAVSSDQLISVLDALGISYTKAGDATGVEPTPNEELELKVLDTSKLSELLNKANDKDAAEYTEESYATLKSAIKKASEALTSDSQADIDAAVEDLQEAMDGLAVKTSAPLNQMALIGVMVVVVVIIIAVVIVLIVLSKKKKTEAKSQAPVTPQPTVQPSVQPAPQTPVAPVTPVAPGSNETSVLNQGAGETSVLNQGAGETTVLAQQVNGGMLTRTSNNEKIPVNSAEFTIGRERNKVDYCVGGNTNISRIHARFVVREEKTYLVDNKAANGTFVNGIKARPGQEIELKSGDKIVLADEKFEFTK